MSSTLLDADVPPSPKPTPRRNTHLCVAEIDEESGEVTIYDDHGDIYDGNGKKTMEKKSEHGTVGERRLTIRSAKYDLNNK